MIITKMTFTHVERMAKEQLEKSSKVYGEILLKSVLDAIECQRITSGVSECAKLLSRFPENVMFCLLFDAGSENISVHIQHTLIEAFCWENDIRMLKVKTCENSVENSSSARKDTILSNTSCMLIEYPKQQLSETDDKMMDYYETVINGDIYPKPVIELPI